MRRYNASDYLGADTQIILDLSNCPYVTDGQPLVDQLLLITF